MVTKPGVPIERVSSAGDARLAVYRGVADPELARTGGYFIAEGRLVVRRVIEDGRYRVRSLLVNDAAAVQLADALSTVAAAGAPIYVGAPAIFAGLTGFNVHRGCLALVDRPAPKAVDEVIAGASTVVVLDGVANADNVGGAFRNAAAFAADAVVLGPASCDPLYRKAIRTSMGSVLRVPFAAGAWPGALERIRDAGFTIVALTPRAPSVPLAAFARRGRPARIALVAGAEGEGVSPEVERVAACRVRIPIADDVDSLNVGVAIGIALYELRTSPVRRSRSGAGATPTSPGRRTATSSRR